MSRDSSISGAGSADQAPPGADAIHRAAWSDIALLCLGAALLFGLALGARDLWNPNEAIYGQAVAEMAQRGDWVIPTVNGKVFAEKPILYFWAARASAELLGEVDELSLRVPSVLVGVLAVVLTYLLVLPYGGRRRAVLAAAMLATQFQVFWIAHWGKIDIGIRA